MEIGSLIQYYDDGWRTGHLVEYEEETTGRGKNRTGKRTGWVLVRPIRLYGVARCIRVHLNDIKEASVKGFGKV